MKSKTIIIVLLGVTLAIALVALRLHSAWHFRLIDPVVPGSCTAVSGVVGVEDITVDRSTGIAYLSACDRRAVAEGRPAAAGIYAYDLNRQNPVPIRIDGGQLGDFQPHGIDLLLGKTVAVGLFAVNHGNGRNTIELFDLNGLQLSHRKTISASLLISPNDVTALDGERFYVTNDHGSRGQIGKILEDYLNLRRSGVVYYDGVEFKTVAKDIGYANGIALGRDGRSVFVAATTEGTVRVYGRDAISGVLALQQTVECATAVDNIDVDASGALWVGAHPKPLKFVLHARSAAHRSPSEVLRLTPGPAGTYVQRTVFLDDGARLSGCSVAVVYRERLLIGSVFEPFFLDCRIKPAAISP